MWIILGLLLLILHAGQAAAGMSPVGAPKEPAEKVEPAEQAKLTDEQKLQRLLDRVVGLDQPLFDADDLAPPDCESGRQGVTRGLFVAAGKGFEIENFWLPGPDNDVELFRNTLALRGADPDKLIVLHEDQATYSVVSVAARALAEATDCGDSVIVQFSGFAVDPEYIPVPDEGVGPFSNGRKLGNLDELTGDAMKHGIGDTIAAGGPFALLNFHAPGYGDVLSAAALSELVTVLRNRGADVSVILDAPSANTFLLEARQAQIDPRLYTKLDLEDQWCGPQRQRSFTACGAAVTWEPTLLSPRAGALTLFYGTQRGEAGQERKLPLTAPPRDRKIYGLFSYRLATAIAVSERTTIGALSRHISERSDMDMRRQRYRMITTDPDLDLIAEDRPERGPKEGRIVIDTPETTRTARKRTRPELRVAGHVLSRGEPISVEVNGRPAVLTPDRGFEAELVLQAGVNVVEIFAVTRQNEAITHRFELFYEGDIRAVIGEGKRYAVLIANQDYADGSGISDLQTPVGDAEALARVLSERYGFQTELELPQGGTLDLFLKNAGQRETGLLMDQLSQAIGERDSVIVFYAGHGEYEERGSAYWLPADAVANAYSTYIDAGDITRALNRMRAKNVLLISDSCYSGMLLRSTHQDAEMPGNEDRLRMLQRLADKRSRIVISSGLNEPVLDSGGDDGHSVFADALLRALREPDESAFSARELFNKVVSRVTALASQTPDFRPIHGAGHDGGDFVFLARDD